MVKVLSKSFVLPCRYCKLNCLIAGSFIHSFRLRHVHQLAVASCFWLLLWDHNCPHLCWDAPQKHGQRGWKRCKIVFTAFLHVYIHINTLYTPSQKAVWNMDHCKIFVKNEEISRFSAKYGNASSMLVSLWGFHGGDVANAFADAKGWTWKLRFGTFTIWTEWVGWI